MRISGVILAGLLAFSASSLASAETAGTKAEAVPSSNPISAEKIGTRAEAIAMVRLVQKRFKEDGAKKTFAAINDKSAKEFHYLDLYPFVYTLEGVCVAHGVKPTLVGKNLSSLNDPGGKYLIRDMAKLSQQGDGWYNYRWPNPTTNTIDDKASFYSKLGTKYFVGVGVYRAAK